MLERLSWIALLAPFAVAIYLGFSAGGFFAGETAVGAAALLLILMVRVLTGEHPLAGADPWLVTAGGAIAAFGVWVLLSHLWSDSAARSLIEFDRVLLYLVALLLPGLLLRTRDRVQLATWAALAAVSVLCVAALLTRVLPDAFPADPGLDAARLSFPLTYWNGMGILAALGIVLSVGVASDRAQPGRARPLAAALVVPLVATLYFTLSRGAILACVLALVAFAIVARPRHLLTTVLAVAPFAAIALVVCYGADVLTTEDFASAQGVDQGRTVALVVVGTALAAGVAQALALNLDRSLDELRLAEQTRRGLAVASAAAAALVLILAVTVLDAPAEIDQQIEQFTQGGEVDVSEENSRSRLTDFSNNRAEHWEIAVDAWQDRPAVGQGAGTFALEWARERPSDFAVFDAHSLYLEVLSELGLVGLLLLLVGIGAMLVGAARRCSGPDRVLYGAVLAALICWAAHAGIDWDWEVPAVTLIPFALAGAVLASDRPRIKPPERLARVIAGIGMLFVLLTPVSIWLSQNRLDDAVAAIRGGDCAVATERALSSIDALPVRPEPYEILAYCNAGAGDGRLARVMAARAVERDPDNWETHYALAIALGVDGKDPRAAIERARALNPRDGRVRRLARQLSGDDPQQWGAAARTAPLLLPP